MSKPRTLSAKEWHTDHMYSSALGFAKRNSVSMNMSTHSRVGTIEHTNLRHEEPVGSFLNRMMRRGPSDGFISIFSVLGFCLLFTACTSVDTILLTSETFPSKQSADEVTVLEQKPSRPYLEIAELRIGDSGLSFGNLQHKILNRAAALGADAVVFSSPQTQTIRQVAYEPYDPWGYNSPYYGGPWGYSGGFGGPYGGWGPWGGFSGGIAVPYDESIRMLMGTAIRYTGTNQPLTTSPLK